MTTMCKADFHDSVVDCADAFAARGLADNQSKRYGDSPDVRRAIASMAFWSALGGKKGKQAVREATNPLPPSAA
jgi:hypothetical protein